MNYVVTAVFMGCVFAVLLTYCAYPLGLLIVTKARRGRVARSPDMLGEKLPTVTLVVSAYNEQAVIREKLENALSLDYPAEHLEIMVISDASEDATDEIVSSYADRGVVLCRQEPRRGKSAGLTQFVPQARGEIVMFSDANSIYEPDALRKLVRHFVDPHVGFAVGHQRYVEADCPSSVSESLYWRYETWIKIQESRLGSAVCGDGAIYAIRAELFEPLKADDINDFTLPLKIVARGYRGVFDEAAVCYEETADDFRGEFRRKARIVNRSLRAVTRVPRVLNPFCVGRFAFQLGVHKIVRWFVPFFLLGLLLSTIWLSLSGSIVYAVFLALQVSFYMTALLGLVPGIRRWQPVYIASYFCAINAAAALGIVQCLFGRTVAVWNPERSPSESTLTMAGRATGTR